MSLPSSVEPSCPDGAQYPVDADITVLWTREQVAVLEVRPEQTAPAIAADFPVMSDEVWLWDTWPLTDLSMRPVSVNGWHLIFGLVAPRTLPFDDRHAFARIGWFASRDGHAWTYCGHALPCGTALGTRQWSGCAVLLGDRVHLLYTASGEGINAGPDWEHTDFVQRVAHATAVLEADEAHVGFDGPAFSDSAVVAEGDGQLYQTAEQARGSEIIYGFRDPFVFADGTDVFMSFAGNLAGPGCFTGAAGLARARDAGLGHWELLPPLLAAPGVNQQLERPHFVRHGGLYYLFFISHPETYAPGLTGPDALYAFVGTSLRSDYQPVNGTAVVMANPPGRPPERFADYVMPNWLVEGFIDNVAGRRGGTLAPTVRLEAEGAEITVVEALDYAFIPVMANVTVPWRHAGEPVAAPPQLPHPPGRTGPIVLCSDHGKAGSDPRR